MAIPLKPVSEQVIVITGASNAIGLMTAESAAEQGAKLVLVGDSDALEEAAVRLSKNGAEAMAIDAAFGDRAQAEQLAVAAIERFGRIDTWVNNASAPMYGRLDQMSEKESRRLFDTNFWGVVHGSLAALRHMRAAGGAIINVGSDVADPVLPLHGMTAASKHAVRGFTDSLRVEVEELDRAPVAITLIHAEAAGDAGDRPPRRAAEPIAPIVPTEVAEAILKAAASHTRSINVGAPSKVNGTPVKVNQGR